MKSKAIEQRTSLGGTAGVKQGAAAAALDSRLVDQESPFAGGDVAIRDVRRALGLSRRDFSRLTGFSERAIAGWESGERPSGQSQQHLREIQELQKALNEIMPPESIGPWLLRPNDAFAGLKPLEVIERGEIHRIWRMIFYLQSGVPS